ncbi:gliding motility-associated C-terminal domain-containing protein [Mucilaginibacter sp.]|uniref:T9SS type B sorting domain-containing protein n=1 Tax=Mucilaginibacter sp. TaxID=1882438 RepID=UPI00260B8F3E|nr:gliding motility-associated C-terminal domain-containing protein [Mucilaginibacter sp.]MDB5031396.1 beta-propeller fold lactonase family protein [Mucilaginibacter sp.]
MKRRLFIFTFFYFFFTISVTKAQTGQTISNGDNTTVINFPGTGCAYFWTNSNPSIGLPSKGEGNIPSFTAINTGTVPVTATITATPVTGGTAYIANSGDGTISLIDVRTNTLTNTLPVGSNPFEVSVTPGGAWLYISNPDANMVSVLNTTTNAIEKTITVGYQPVDLVVSPDGTTVYVVNSGDNTVSIINTATKTVTGLISLPSFGRLGAIAISPDGNKIYIGSTSVSKLAVVNTTTHSTSVISLGTIGASYGVTVSPDGRTVYVGAGMLVVVNAATNSVITTINTGFAPYHIAITSNGLYVYVTNANSNTVSVVNTATNTIVTNISVYIQPQNLVLSADDGSLYVINYRSNLVSVINTSSNTLLTNIPVGYFPRGAVISKSGTGCAPVTFNIIVNPGTATTNTGTTPTKIIVNNTFTPNGDGINDTWNIKNIENYPKCTVDIFNRYGKSIFFSSGYSIAWDGKYKQSNVPVGTYYYVIDLKDDSKPITGSLTIIR